MVIASVNAKKLARTFWAIGLYKASVSVMSFLASLGIGTKLIDGVALDENGLVLVRYCAWFCLFISMVHVKAALNPESWCSLLWVDTVFFGLSALSPLLNLVVAGSLLWIWWAAATFDFVVFLFCFTQLRANDRQR